MKWWFLIFFVHQMASTISIHRQKPSWKMNGMVGPLSGFGSCAQADGTWYAYVCGLCEFSLAFDNENWKHTPWIISRHSLLYYIIINVRAFVIFNFVFPHFLCIMHVFAMYSALSSMSHFNAMIRQMEVGEVLTCFAVVFIGHRLWWAEEQSR